MKNIVEIMNMSLFINNYRILENISIKIEQGEICGLSGRNGSGKSMLLKVISGLIPATSGAVRVFDKLVGVNGLFAKDLGILIEQPGILLNYSAYQNLFVLGSIKNSIPKNVLSEQIKNILEKLGLSYSDKRPAKYYSLGMKQKLGIAQAMLGNPSLILLDEPSNNLDSNSISDLHNFIKEMKANYNTTFIIASHQNQDFEQLCTRTVQIESGRLV